MISIIQQWGREFYSSESHFIKAGKAFVEGISQTSPEEADIRGLKVIFCAPALLACGIQVIGLLPLKPIVAIMTVADAILYHFSEKNFQVSKWADKHELDLRLIRLSNLVWMTGHLFHTVRFPASVPAVMEAKFLSSWLLSWPVVFVAAKVLDLIIKQITSLKLTDLSEGLTTRLDEETIKISLKSAGAGDGVFCEHIIKELNGKTRQLERFSHPSLWILICGQIITLSLAIFSKSKLTFLALSTLNFYTLYKMAYTYLLNVDWQFKRFCDGKEITFRWQATSLVGKKGSDAISLQLNSLLKVAESFEIINLIRSGCIYSNKDLLKELHKQDYLLDGKLSISMKGKNVKLHSLNCEIGKEIAVVIEGFNERMQTVYGKLSEGVIVYFPNVTPERASKVEQLDVKAQIVSKYIRNNTLYLICSSKDLHEEKIKSLKRSIEHDRFLIRIEGDAFGEKPEFEERFNHFPLINHVTRLAQIKGGQEIGADYKVYAEKDNHPGCERLLVWVEDPNWGFSLADIVWLDYLPGQSLQVKIERFDKDAMIAYGLLSESDPTKVIFRKVPSELAEKEQGRSIDAQIVSKFTRNGFLYLECSSQALTAQKKKVKIFHEFYQTPLTQRISVQYQAVFTPQLNEEWKDECPICMEEKFDVLYSMCTSSHGYCKPCLTQLFQTKIADFKIVNVDLSEGNYKACVEKETLPICTICRQEASSEDEILVSIDNQALDITHIDYEPGKTIQIKIDEFNPGYYCSATATLTDGTIVEFINVQQVAAQRLIASQEAIDAQIVRKTIENGTLYLSCISDKLPKRREFNLNDELDVTLVDYDNGSFGEPFGFLPSGEKVYVYAEGVTLGIDMKVYVWDEKQTEEGICLICLPWQKDQIIEVQLLHYSPHDPTCLVGRLTNNQKVLFYGGAELDTIAYSLPIVINARVCNFRYVSYGNCYLICSPEN